MSLLINASNIFSEEQTPLKSVTF